MKKFNISATAAWMIKNPGKIMSIYNIPGIVGKSYPLAANPVNITAGFRQAGIVPFNRDPSIYVLTMILDLLRIEWTQTNRPL